MMHHLNWYEKQQEKKRDNHKANEISLLNQGLKRQLKRVQSFIKRQDYLEESRKLSRPIVQSNIWDIGWRNNLENPEVAVAQAMLIQTVLKREGSMIKNSNSIQHEVDNLMRRLGNVDWGMYQNYCREVQYIN